MRAFLVICLLFIHSAWSHETVDEEFIGWHQKVGMKNAELIKLSEEVTLNSRIVGGAVAPVYAHPYLAGLLIDIIGFSSPSACGGTLLSANRILTAAHCWFDGFNQAHRITAVLGSPFLFHGGVRVFPSAIAIHPTYDFRTFANDIAMLYLPVHIQFSGQIQPIALPSGSLLHMDYTNETVIAAGYGRYSDVTNPTTNTMARNVLLEVIELQKCRSYYGDLVLDSNICTNGYGGVGICQGDSGGPLTINVNGEPVLIGVSSFVARDGCELQFPSAFARVSSYINWIRVQI
ncbi:brachyurin-like [Spodoptera litura]|uniref:Brachyurin-like n=1 Tax=Spodoptera litura TaxID=69820 RepID=A0A9J7DR48_SPOLT|nr:brachyurin-like [Spodoptera litura]